MNYNLLKKLCFAHAVTGDTDEIKTVLIEELKSRGIAFYKNGYGTIIFGNTKNPQKLIASHIDEVGFQITKIEENGKVRILPVGWIFANRLDHAIVYAQTQKGKVTGVILHEDELKTENLTSFNSLYLDVGVDTKDEVQKLGIQEGQTGSYKKEFIETEQNIIASSLDNKVSQFAVFEILDQNPEFLEENMFAFITDEEMQDQSANGICDSYKPDLAIVLDYCPIHQKVGNAESLGESGKGPLVMYRGGAHIIHEDIRNFFETKINLPFQKGFLSADTVHQLEPFNFQNNGHTKAVNVCVPAFGYHGAGYSLRKKDIYDFCKFLKEVINQKF
ncbi:MAG: hypothetical protein N2558_01035 [Patescibacteria group bacterium]|nr:hypothetical protein [Patescibacteria group bacterium]